MPRSKDPNCGREEAVLWNVHRSIRHWVSPSSDVVGEELGTCMNSQNMWGGEGGNFKSVICVL